MELESYFEFDDFNEVRIKGHRIYVHNIANNHNKGLSPEEIAEQFGGLSLDKVYASILYYLLNTEKIDTYIRELNEVTEAAWQEQRRNPSPIILRLLERKAELLQQRLLEANPTQEEESTNEATLPAR